MRTVAVVLVCCCLAAALCFGQTPSSKYQVGNIISAKARPAIPGEDPPVVRYDVTLRVGNTDYIVLYTPAAGTDTVEYRLGRDGLVLVGTNTIKYYDLLGRPHEVPILRRRPVPPKADR